MSAAQAYRQKPPKEKSRPALDLLDESFHRLRTAPPSALGIYYAGSLPFILGLLYFWADLSHGADAERYGTGAALGMAALFLWMKTCHAAFAGRLRAGFNRRPPERWSARGLLNLFLVQSVLQSVGLFVLFVALVLTVPFGWAYAFCQSATAIGAGNEGTVREVSRRAARASLLWPKQNHLMLLIFSLLGMFAWLNVLSATLGIPYLLKLLTGEDNIFTRSGTDVVNSTFLMVTLSLAYLLLDPVVKTFYVLRCFYADSQYSGEDLRSELRALSLPRASVVTGAATGPGAPADGGGTPGATRRPAISVAGVATLAALVGLGLLVPAKAQAAPRPAPPTLAALAPASTPPGGPARATTGTNIRPPELDKSIEEVMHRREFAWRVPPTPGVETPPQHGFFDSALNWTKDVFTWLFKQLARAFRAVRDWWNALKKWWSHDNDEARPAPVNPSGGFNGDRVILQRMIYALIAVILAVLLYQGWRTWRRRATPELAGRAAPAGALAVPDLSDEQVLATQLPEDEWLQLARRLADGGEHRLALRALYLSILALLGTRGLLVIARHKSNRDYLAELRRRARDRADLQMAFTHNVNRYERVWYGPHPAGQALFDQFLADRQVICDATVPASGPPVLA